MEIAPGVRQRVAPLRGQRQLPHRRAHRRWRQVTRAVLDCSEMHISIHCVAPHQMGARGHRQPRDHRRLAPAQGLRRVDQGHGRRLLAGGRGRLQARPQRIPRRPLLPARRQ